MTKTKWLVLALFVSLVGNVAFFMYRHMSKQEYRAVHVAAIELRSALSVGLAYSEFGARLSKLDSEIQLASEEGLGRHEIAIYRDALTMYKDSYDLWSDKLTNPGLYNSLDQRGVLPDKLKGLIKKYRVSVKPEFQRQADTVEELEREGREQLTFMHGYFDLNAAFDAVLQGIWSTAGEKLNELPHNGR